jgi:hypothetical protein
MDLERIRTLTKEERIATNLEDLTMSEMKAVIAETILMEENIKIAELRFLKLYTAEKIADKLGYDQRTIANRIKFIKERLKNTIMNV